MCNIVRPVQLDGIGTGFSTADTKGYSKRAPRPLTIVPEPPLIVADEDQMGEDFVRHYLLSLKDLSLADEACISWAS